MIEGRPTGEQPDEYIEAAVQRLLAEESGLAEQGLALTRHKDILVLSGEVESPRRRDEIIRRLRERFPDVPLSADIGVTRVHEPTEAEEMS
jgi:hypothetical protein